MLEIHDLSFGYPGRTLFAGLNARIGPGLTLVRGGDGSGKTTMLRLLAAQVPLQGGRLSLNGLEPVADPQAWREQVCLVDTQNPSIDALLLQDWLASPSAAGPVRDDGKQHDASVLADLVEALGLRPHLGKSFFMLSAGTRRKAGLAAAFTFGAAVTLLDQPFAALDRASIQLLLELLAEAAAHTDRAWILADAVAPPDLPLAGIIDLDD